MGFNSTPLRQFSMKVNTKHRNSLFASYHKITKTKNEQKGRTSVQLTKEASGDTVHVRGARQGPQSLQNLVSPPDHTDRTVHVRGAGQGPQSFQNLVSHPDHTDRTFGGEHKSESITFLNGCHPKTYVCVVSVVIVLRLPFQCSRPLHHDM